VWFSLGENHEKADRSGLHQLRNSSGNWNFRKREWQPPIRYEQSRERTIARIPDNEEKRHAKQ
jgi:hypothetical protein